jgi:hypothetical protein
VINNYLLIREGFVPINIKFIDRSKYYEAFKEFDEKGRTAIMEEIVGKALILIVIISDWPIWKVKK